MAIDLHVKCEIPQSLKMYDNKSIMFYTLRNATGKIGDLINETINDDILKHNFDLTVNNVEGTDIPNDIRIDFVAMSLDEYKELIKKSEALDDLTDILSRGELF